MADNKRIAKNTLFLYFRMFLIMGANLYVSRVILKALGASDYGLYNVVGGIVAMFTFMNSSLASATSRYITLELGRKNNDRLRKVFNIALLMHVAIALLIVMLSETAGLWFFYEKMTIPAERFDAAFTVYQISILTCFFTLTQIPYNATIIAHENMKIYAWVGIVEAVGKIMIALALFVAPFDRLVFYAVLLCALQIAIMIFYRLYCSRNFAESRFKFYKDWPLYKEMFLFGSSDLIGNLSVMAQGQGLNILLNMFFGPVVNAARGIAYQVQGAVAQFSSNFMTAVKPQIIKSYAMGDIDGMMGIMKNSSLFSFYLMWLITLPVLLETEYVLGLWLGDFPDHSVSFLRLVMVLSLIQGLKTPRTTVFHATGHIKFVNITVGTILCLALPVSYICLKSGCRPESVFIVSIATMLFSDLVSVFILKRYVEYSIKDYAISVYGKSAAVAAISGLIPYFVFDMPADASFLRLLSTCLISSASIGITVWYIGMDSSLRVRVKNYIRSTVCRA